MISSNLFSLKYGNNPALISDEYIVTYSDIVIQIDEMVNVNEGKNLILHICSNSIDSILGYIFHINLRQVDMLVDSNISIEVLKEIIKKYHPEYIYMPSEWLLKEKIASHIY